MTHIQLDYGKTLEFFDKHELDQQKDIVKTIHQTIHKGTGAGNDFLGWLDLPVDYDKGYDVVACCLDVGEGKDLDVVYQKALDMGAVECHIIDATIRNIWNATIGMCK